MREGRLGNRVWEIPESMEMYHKIMIILKWEEKKQSENPDRMSQWYMKATFIG